MKKFDLNIEKILENWEMHHAIREIIANALDEQLLTKTKDVVEEAFGDGFICSHFWGVHNKQVYTSPVCSLTFFINS